MDVNQRENVTCWRNYQLTEQAGKGDEEGLASHEPNQAIDVAPSILLQDNVAQPVGESSRLPTHRAQAAHKVPGQWKAATLKLPLAEALLLAYCRAFSFFSGLLPEGNEAVGMSCQPHTSAVMHSRQGFDENITKCSAHSKPS